MLTKEYKNDVSTFAFLCSNLTYYSNWIISTYDFNRFFYYISIKSIKYLVISKSYLIESHFTTALVHHKKNMLNIYHLHYPNTTPTTLPDCHWHCYRQKCTTKKGSDDNLITIKCIHIFVLIFTRCKRCSAMHKCTYGIKGKH